MVMTCSGNPKADQHLCQIPSVRLPKLHSRCTAPEGKCLGKPNVLRLHFKGNGCTPREAFLHREGRNPALRGKLSCTAREETLHSGGRPTAVETLFFLD